MNKTADFRSDTVTRPSQAMRDAMAAAEVGDDVYGEDPTVNRLEEQCAETFGKQAAVYLPSGTMGNQAAIAAHTSAGEEIICDDRSHIVLYEMGMAAQFSGCLLRSVATKDGLLRWDDIEPRLRKPSDHYRGTSLIALENTHNMAGGVVYPLELLREIGDRAKDAGVSVHMDGARVFNAAAALGCSVKQIAAPVDSVTFCLSKGLGAPVGSVLVGDAAFIERARLARKGLGGGMRQAGVLAAACLVALEQSPATLPMANADAAYLGCELSKVDGIEVDPPRIATNIVFFRVTRPGLSEDALRERLKAQGILASGVYKRVRMLTHLDVDRADCERAIDAIRRIVGE